LAFSELLIFRQKSYSLEITAKTMAISSITRDMSSLKEATSDTRSPTEPSELCLSPADHQMLRVGLSCVTKSHRYTQSAKWNRFGEVSSNGLYVFGISVVLGGQCTGL